MRRFLCFLSIISVAISVCGGNLLKDAGFQEIDASGNLKDWTLRGTGKRLLQPDGQYALELEVGKDKKTVSWAQSDLDLKKNQYYALSVYFKADKETPFSAYVEIEPGRSHISLAQQGTGKWDRLLFIFKYLGDKPAKCVFRISQKGKVLIKQPELLTYDKRLVNGDFSQGLTKWSRLGGQVAISKQAGEYGNALELMSRTAGRNAGAVFKGVQLFGGRNYLLTYEVKGSLEKDLTDSTRASWFRMYPAINGKALENCGEWLDCFPVWQKKHLSFKVEKDCIADLICELRAPGQAWFDNIQLEEAEVARKPIDILLDPPAAYRDGIFASQKGIENISGVVRLDIPGVRRISVSLAGKTQELKVNSNEVKFTLPVPSEYGTYPLTVKAGDAENRQIASSELKFSAYPPAKREISFRNDHVMLIDGKPFFPLMSWRVRGTWTTEDKAASLAAAGFNAWFTEAADFDIAASHGLFTFLSVCREFPLRKTPESELRREQQEAYLSQLKRISKHPALLGYFFVDEPAWCGKDPSPLLETYEIIRQLDPYKPVWLNEAPRGKVLDLRKYAAACDVYGIDIYPIPSPSPHSGLGDKMMTSVGKYTDICREIVEDRKPVWMALQGFSWQEIYHRSPVVYPTHQENRFMAYDAIVHGAVGLTWWGINWRVDKREFLDLLGQTVREIRSISAVLVSPRISGKLKNNRPQLRTMIRRHENINYYFVVNESGDEFTADFSGEFPAELTVLFENRKLKTNGKSFRDSFKPYDVHVYSESAQLPAPLPLPELNIATYKISRAESDNEVVNPDFTQLDFNSGILAPDQWRSHPARSGSLVDNPERPGELLLKQMPANGDAAYWIGKLKNINIGQNYKCMARVKADKGTSFRVYVERSRPSFRSFGKWHEGNGEWQDIEFEFNYATPGGHTPYIVFCTKGEGVSYAYDFKVTPVK